MGEALGYEIDAVEHSYTNEPVTRFAKVGTEYPNYTIVRSADDNENKKLTLHVTKILPSMFNCSSKDSSPDAYITIYLRDGEKKIKLGRIMSRQVKPFLRLFDGFDIEGSLSKGKELVGDYLYVLSE